MKLTRRAWAGAIAAAVTRLDAQQKAPGRQELDKAAAARRRRDYDRIARFEVPMSTEPAFTFKA